VKSEHASNVQEACEYRARGWHNYSLVEAIRKNIIRWLLAGERHETVQPNVLSSPQPEHFNLDAKSESLPAPKSDEPPQMGSRRSRPDIVYIRRRDAKVLTVKGILTALCHYARARAVTQTTNLRD
jgi:hypothetical protein